MRTTLANYGCLVTWFILSTSFISAIWIIFVDWAICAFHAGRNISELLDANLHHLTPFYLFDHLCQMAPLC